MNLLALDLATSTGWCLRENGRLESGVETFHPRRHESPGMRYLAFSRWLEGLVFASATNAQGLTEPVGPPRVQLIVYEAILGRFARGGAQAEIAAGFSTRVLEFCARHHLDHHGDTYPATLKKWATGRGNADKAAMLEAVARRWRRVDDHNEADAVALLHFAEAEIVPSAAR